MIDLEKAFAELPPPAPDAGDAGAARRIWLRARVAPIAKERLRFASFALLLGALDAIAMLLIATAVSA
jgi:hypothetical protein